MQDLHCDELQGFLISPPLPAAGISELLTHSVEIKRMIVRDGVRSKIAHGATTGIYGVLNEYDAGEVSVASLASTSWAGNSKLLAKASLS